MLCVCITVGGAGLAQPALAVTPSTFQIEPTGVSGATEAPFALAAQTLFYGESASDGSAVLKAARVGEREPR